MVTMATTDREALVALFQATDGDGWIRKDNWETFAGLSLWYGVNENEQGRVVELSLENNNLALERMDVLTSTKNPQTSNRLHGHGWLKTIGETAGECSHLGVGGKSRQVRFCRDWATWGACKVSILRGTG